MAGSRSGITYHCLRPREQCARCRGGRVCVVLIFRSSTMGTAVLTLQWSGWRRKEEGTDSNRGAWKHLANSCTGSPIRSSYSLHSSFHPLSLYSSISGKCLYRDITAFNYSRWFREKLWLLIHLCPRAWTQCVDMQTQQRFKYRPAVPCLLVHLAVFSALPATNTGAVD